MRRWHLSAAEALARFDGEGLSGSADQSPGRHADLPFGRVTVKPDGIEVIESTSCVATRTDARSGALTHEHRNVA
jgi:hypothetical protein